MSNQGNFIEGAGYTLLAGRGPVRQQAINDSNFEAKPLAIAIDELATELSAANDQHRGQTFDRVLELDDDALLAWFYTARRGQLIHAIQRSRRIPGGLSNHRPASQLASGQALPWQPRSR